jgi:hypothetical protein
MNTFNKIINKKSKTFFLKVISTILFLSFINFNLNSQCNTLYNGQRINGFVTSKSTGIEALDLKINEEYTKLCNFFYLNLPLGYFQESKDDSFGQAFYSPVDKAILLGKKLIVTMYNKTQNFDLVTAVLAHEFGHAVQDSYNWGKNYKYTELHADFLAGFYIGKKNLFKSETDLNIFVNEFYNLGDSDFFNSDHHGTPDERG